MRREAERGEGREMLRGAVALVAGPGVGGVTASEQAHQAVAHRFRDHRGGGDRVAAGVAVHDRQDRKSTRLNSSHLVISYAVFCLKKKKQTPISRSAASLPTCPTGS